MVRRLAGVARREEAPAATRKEPRFPPPPVQYEDDPDDDWDDANGPMTPEQWWEWLNRYEDKRAARKAAK
jgi:hypothetical protein